MSNIRPILLLLFLISYSRLVAQCPPAVSAPACTGSEPLVIANEIIGSHTTKWYYGGTNAISSLTLRGGKLIICGDLTIDRFYMDSGQVIVNPGGRLVLAGIDGGLVLKGNSSIYNFGTLEIQRNLSLESGWSTAATPNIVVNMSVLRMSNQYFVINDPNSWFVNKGQAEFWGIITDTRSSANSVCLGIQSTTAMAVLINKIPNTYTVTMGSACVYVRQFSQFFGQLTSSHGLYACVSATHTSDVACLSSGCLPNNWGEAQVFNNCSNCGALTVLPVKFISFDMASSGNRNILKWQMDIHSSDYTFFVERSADGKSFYQLDSIRVSRGENFSYIDNNVPQDVVYYRIKAVEMYSGQSIVSTTISSSMHAYTVMKLYPSPFSNFFYVRPPTGAPVIKIIVHDISGNIIPIVYQQEKGEWRVTPLVPVPRQTLVVQVVTNTGVQTGKIIRQG